MMTSLERTIADKLLNEISGADLHRRANVIEEYRAFLDAVRTRINIDNPPISPYVPFTGEDYRPYPWTTCTTTGEVTKGNTLACNSKELTQHGGQE